MSKIIVDATILEKLRNLEQPVELCDEAGRTLGKFFPRLDPKKYNLEPQISEEEIERRRKSKERTYTTAEVLAHLEKL